MKKQLLTTGIFFLFIFNLQAQEDNGFIKNKTRFGIKAGINFTNLYDASSKDILDSDIYIGVFSETRFSEKWSFESGLNYSESSGYSFVEIPLVLKYHINNKWSVFAGPQLDITVEPNGINANTEFEPLGISLVLGTQYNFSKNFFIEGRINLGLTRQIDTSFDQNFNSFSRRVFRIGIGYRF